MSSWCMQRVYSRYYEEESYNSKAIENSSITEISGKLVYNDIPNSWNDKYFYKCPCCNDVSKDYTVTFGKIFMTRKNHQALRLFL